MMNARRRMLALGVAGLLAGGGVMWREPRLQAVDPPEPDRQSFGMFGIVAGQTARLNIVSGDPPSETPVACPVHLEFLDSEGRAIAQSDLRVKPGQARHLNFTLTDGTAPLRAGLVAPATRVQIRAAWNVVDPPDPDVDPPDPDRQCAPSRFIATVEVIGSDGETRVLYALPGPLAERLSTLPE